MYYTTSKISKNMHKTPEGFLVCIGVPIARTGDMVYGKNEVPEEIESDSNGTVTVTRDEDDVFHPNTLASFQGKPVTIRHPEEFVTPQNWKELTIGTMQNVRRGEGENKDDVIADLLITDDMGIGLVENGMREVSCGYEANYVQTEKGKAKQKVIVGNHLALVDEGRAGHAYAIKDHKGASMGMFDKMKSKVAKVMDEAEKEMKDAEAEEKPKEEKKKSEDEHAASFDELKKSVDAISAKLDAMKAPSKDEEKPEAKKEDKEESKDEDLESAPEVSMEDRIKALEAAVTQLLQGMSNESEMGDEEMEDEDVQAEGTDEDFKKNTMTGDTASRAEILAPGILLTKDVKAKALKAAYGTKDGKKAIDTFTGGKAPTYDSAEHINMLFVGASEVLKSQRSNEFARTKTADSGTPVHKGAMTPDQINEINEKYWLKTK